jgi:tol-pal system protein YbgF
MVDDHQKSLQELEKIAPNPAAAPEKATAPPRALPTDEKMSTAALQAKPPSVMSESAEAAYKRALSVYNAKNYTEAAAMFAGIAENYPGHDLADNALYWIGECRYSQKDFKGAISAFKKVVRDYPKGSKVPDALLKIGYAYLILGDRVNAQSFLKKVVKAYPFTPAGAKAGEMLKKMQTP